MYLDNMYVNYLQILAKLILFLSNSSKLPNLFTRCRTNMKNVLLINR